MKEFNFFFKCLPAATRLELGSFVVLVVALYPIRGAAFSPHLADRLMMRLGASRFCSSRIVCLKLAHGKHGPNHLMNVLSIRILILTIEGRYLDSLVFLMLLCVNSSLEVKVECHCLSLKQKA